MSKTKRLHLTDRQKTIILEKTNNKCAHCGKTMHIKEATIDHILPLNKGGLNDEYNLLPLCEECNEKKSNFVYSFDDYYKHVKIEELENYQSYNHFATFDYTQKTIMGYDETVFYMLPPEHKIMLNSMVKRKTKKSKLIKAYDNLLVPILLRKAYPKSAEDIYKLMSYQKQKYNIKNPLYSSPFDIEIDIKSGVVYTLEKNDHICGAFIFRSIDQISENIQTQQITNISDHFGFDLKYVMTAAIINKFAASVFDDVMNYLEMSQIQNKIMPIWFDILTTCYSHKSKCIIMPFNINGVNGNLEFMPISHLNDIYSDIAAFKFKEREYQDISDDDIEFFADALIRYVYQRDFADNNEALEFFNRYPKLKDYFKPETFYLYNKGFIHE